jgi:hypothetical protein
MSSIDEKALLANLPAAELMQALREFLAPVLRHLPEQRLRTVAVLAVRGVLAAQAPVLTEMARGGQAEDGSSWSLARRYERPYLVVAIDPVNFEKPYTEDLAGVSTVLKSTPPGPRREKRLTPGCPAITAAIVNLPDGRCRIAVITYANWFSYRTADFLSQNREI